MLRYNDEWRAYQLEGCEAEDCVSQHSRKRVVGNIYYRLDQYEKALDYHQKSLDIKIRVVGNHLSVAAS
jgi:tetratricopeptide (TPR) repeat protein